MTIGIANQLVFAIDDVKGAIQAKLASFSVLCVDGDFAWFHHSIPFAIAAHRARAAASISAGVMDTAPAKTNCLGCPRKHEHYNADSGQSYSGH
jgi:hypothetical protein